MYVLCTDMYTYIYIYIYIMHTHQLGSASGTCALPFRPFPYLTWPKTCGKSTGLIIQNTNNNT